MNMAALPPMSSVHDAMIACGVDNTAANEFEGRTQAARVATDIFFDSFETVARKSMKELTTEFKTYTSIRASRIESRHSYNGREMRFDLDGIHQA